MNAPPWTEFRPTACLVLADGLVLEGSGFGATGTAAGEVCFNTAMTGYQEILTDPSYAGQIVTFTFPHIGNVGANEEDVEAVDSRPASGVRGCIVRADVTEPANWRAVRHFDAWLRARGIVGLSGIDTRALTIRIRESGMPNAVIAHDPEGRFDYEALKRQAAQLPSMAGLDLVPEVTTGVSFTWSETPWRPGAGYGVRTDADYHVVALDFGMKRNILRRLTEEGCRVTVLPADARPDDILALNPDGLFLSNGPGDPAATGQYAVPAVRKVIEAGIPTFGICLGHQILGLALGARTTKMHQGHHGANHPVKDRETGRVEITSMNHGFAVDRETLPDNVEETHVSLFDGSNCGLRVKDKPVFSVQYHPEASPGPQDSHYLFRRFVNLMRERKGGGTDAR